MLRAIKYLIFVTIFKKNLLSMLTVAQNGQLFSVIFVLVLNIDI